MMRLEYVVCCFGCYTALVKLEPNGLAGCDACPCFYSTGLLSVVSTAMPCKVVIAFSLPSAKEQLDFLFPHMQVTAEVVLIPV
jgi:hypothetical protein